MKIAAVINKAKLFDIEIIYVFMIRNYL